VQGVIHFWDATGQEIRKPIEVPTSAIHLALSRDCIRLLTGHLDFNARLWDLSNEQQATLVAALRCSGPVGVVAFASDESGTILTGDFDGAIRLWDATTQQPVSPPLWHQNLIRSAVFSALGTQVVTGAGGVTRLWEVTAATSERSHAAYTPPRFPLAFSPDWRTIMTQDGDGMVTLLEASTGRMAGGPIRMTIPLLTGAFSPDHKYAATIGVDRWVRL
jgi:WD40 repeat protein